MRRILVCPSVFHLIELLADVRSTETLTGLSTIRVYREQVSPTLFPLTALVYSSCVSIEPSSQRCRKRSGHGESCVLHGHLDPALAGSSAWPLWKRPHLRDWLACCWVPTYSRLCEDWSRFVAHIEQCVSLSSSLIFENTDWSVVTQIFCMFRSSPPFGK